MSELIITDANFEAEVVSSELPVLIDFYADWCGPCKMMAPVIESLAEAYEGKIKVGKCNIDNEPGLAMRYKIMSIPAIMLLKGGEVAMTSIGAISRDELESKIEAAL